MKVSRVIPTLTEALAARGFDTLTEVQTAVTSPELATADLLVSAQTGSGKTVAFGLAIAPTLMPEEPSLSAPAAPLALVVAPTRELALQVQRELSWLYGKAGAQVTSCIGGMDAREERRALARGAHIVVGTPGRLRDHITRASLDLSDIRAIVLDEADEMLDLGFREDLEFMLDAAPVSRRTLMFSATVPPAIAELAKAYQRNAVRVTAVSRGTQHADIAYQAVQVARGDNENAIINLLRFHDAPSAIVFANTRASVAHLAARLANRGMHCVSLSGELSQDERSHALQAMRDGRARVCVATDVAARGIDLPNLDLVIHADLPTNTEALLHRSGRTGRAGRKGISALIVPDRDTKKAERLLKWAKISAQWRTAPTREEILALDEARLLADPLWSAAPSPAEAEFAARLIAAHPPEQIAAACLRLYRAGLSVPEELNAAPAPGARGAPASAPSRGPRADPRASFGPSAWFEISVGRDRRAEARWLLPLLCRAGGLEKAQIGKIIVRADTTVVEVTEAAAAALAGQIGPGGTLEDGIRARRLEKPPEPEPAHPPARRPEGAQRFKHGPRRAAEPTARAPFKAARAELAPAPAPAPEAAPAPPRKPRHAKRAKGPADGPETPAPARKGAKPGGAKPGGAKPGGAKAHTPRAKGKKEPPRAGGNAPPRRRG